MVSEPGSVENRKWIAHDTGAYSVYGSTEQQCNFIKDYAHGVRRRVKAVSIRRRTWLFDWTCQEYAHKIDERPSAISGLGIFENSRSKEDALKEVCFGED